LESAFADSNLAHNSVEKTRTLASENDASDFLGAHRGVAVALLRGHD
jgi:hypothetical protein